MIEQLMEKFSELGQLATLWELRVRTFADLRNLNPYVVQKKEKEAYYSRKLHKVIEEIHSSFPNLELDLTTPRELRNAIAHANFQEFIDVLDNISGPKKRNGVFQVNISSGETINLKDEIPEGELHKVSMTAMMLSVLNGATLAQAASVFNESINDLNSLIELNGFSAPKNYFEMLLIGGRLPNDQELEEFESYWKKTGLIKEPCSVWFENKKRLMKNQKL